MPDTLFNDDDQSTNTQETQTTEDNYVEKVIAARGEGWKDPNVLAKGYLSSQDHILNLEAENAKLRESNQKQDYMKEVLQRIDEGKAKPSGGEPSSESASTSEAENQGVTVEQIKGLVAEALTEQEAANTSQQNLSKTKEMLKEAFGTEAQAQIEKQRVALGMSKERMDQLASESPTAFMQLMGQTPAKEQNTLPQNSVNSTDALTQPAKRDWVYYTKLRRENPKVYYTPKVQNQLMEDREKLGDEFGLT